MASTATSQARSKLPCIYALPPGPQVRLVLEVQQAISAIVLKIGAQCAQRLGRGAIVAPIPCGRMHIRPPSRNRRRCIDIAGCDTSKAATSAFTGSSVSQTPRRVSRRIESAIRSMEPGTRAPLRRRCAEGAPRTPHAHPGAAAHVGSTCGLLPERTVTGSTVVTRGRGGPAMPG